MSSEDTIVLEDILEEFEMGNGNVYLDKHLVFNDLNDDDFCTLKFHILVYLKYTSGSSFTNDEPLVNDVSDVEWILGSDDYYESESEDDDDSDYEDEDEDDSDYEDEDESEDEDDSDYEDEDESEDEDELDSEYEDEIDSEYEDEIDCGIDSEDESENEEPYYDEQIKMLQMQLSNSRLETQLIIRELNIARNELIEQIEKSRENINQDGLIMTTIMTGILICSSFLAFSTFIQNQ